VFDDPFAPPFEEPPAPAHPEVRRCARCGRPAMVCVREFGAMYFFGVVRRGPSGIRDFVCQQCGRAVTLHPIPWLTLPLAVMGVPLALIGFALACSGVFTEEALVALVFGGILAAFGSVLVGAFTWPIGMLFRYPVVDGVPVPVIRYDEVNPPRRCRCGGEARCVTVTAHRTNFVYSGTGYGYACPTCGHEFQVDSPLLVLFHTVAFAILVGFGALCATKGAQGDKAAWAFAALLFLFGVFAAVLAIARVSNGRRHPLVR